MAGLSGSETIGIVIVVAVLAIALIVAFFRCARLIVEEMQKAPPGQRSFKRAFRSSVRRTARQGVQHVNTIRRSFRRSKPKKQEEQDQDAPPSYNDILNSSATSQLASETPMKNADLIAPAGRRMPKGQQPSSSRLPMRGIEVNKTWEPSSSAYPMKYNDRPHQGGVSRKSYGQSPEADNKRNLQLSDLGVHQPSVQRFFPNTHNAENPITSQYNYANVSGLTNTSNEYEPLRNAGAQDYERYMIPSDRNLQNTHNIDPRSPGFTRTPGVADPRSPAGVPRTPGFNYEEGVSGFRPYVPPNRHLSNGSVRNDRDFTSQMSPRANIPTVSYHPSSHTVPSSNQNDRGETSLELFNHLSGQPDTYI